MTIARFDAFLFDLAGTTVHDENFVLEAFLRTAKNGDLELDPDVLKSRMGWHKQLVFETCLTEAGRDIAPAAELAAAFEHCYADVVRERGLRPTPGARETIDALLTRGIAVAFTTGFSRATADLVLAAVGWSGFASVASTEVENGRPAPDLIRAAMRRLGRNDAVRCGAAGDTPSDLLAGKAAGCSMIVGVGCGTHTLTELEASPHTHLLADLTTLPDLIDGL